VICFLKLITLFWIRYIYLGGSGTKFGMLFSQWPNGKNEEMCASERDEHSWGLELFPETLKGFILGLRINLPHCITAICPVSAPSRLNSGAEKIRNTGPRQRNLSKMLKLLPFLHSTFEFYLHLDVSLKNILFVLLQTRLLRKLFLCIFYNLNFSEVVIMLHWT
jgi:hypothetical protein